MAASPGGAKAPRHGRRRLHDRLPAQGPEPRGASPGGSGVRRSRCAANRWLTTCAAARRRSAGWCPRASAPGRTWPRPRPATPPSRPSSCSCSSRGHRAARGGPGLSGALARAGAAAQRRHRRGAAPEPAADLAAGDPGCDLAVRFHPAQAAELVGGDFYDAFAVSDGRWAIIVGDVCGKGAEAAAMTAMARWTLRSLASWAVGPDEALRFLNRAMLGEDLEGRFITVAYLLLTVENGTAQVSLACAGHPPPILVPAAGDPRLLPRGARCWGSGPTSGSRPRSWPWSTATRSSSTPMASPTPAPGPSASPPRRCATTPRGRCRTARRHARALRHPAARGPRDDIAIVAVQFHRASSAAGRRDPRSASRERRPPARRGRASALRPRRR